MQNANPADLADRWKSLIIECYGDYVPRFTKKEFGQLKTFAEGCPPGQALTILDCCLRHWEDFTEYAKYNYSAFPLPARPTLDFLVKYRAAAMNFVIKEMAKEAKAVKEAAIPKGVLVNPAQKTVAPALKPFAKVSKPKMTQEEFLAIMAEDYVDQGNPAVGLSAGHKKKVGEKPKKELTYDEMMAIEEEEYYGSLNLEK